jgi:hypothetical protein
LEDILNADIRQLNRNSDVAACNILAAFLNQVNAYEGNRLITSQQAMDLRQQATALQHALGCSSSLSSSSSPSSSSDITNGENIVRPFKASS